LSPGQVRIAQLFEKSMIRYRLDDLGWFQFEWLCQSLLKAVLGLAVEAWGGHSDLGRDAYAVGPLPLDGPESQAPGPFVFQAKFVAEANAAGAKPDGSIQRATSREVSRIRERLRKNHIQQPSVYVLLTNAPITPNLREKLAGIIHTVLPETRVITWGANDVCSMLDGAPQIRVAFPQLLGLRDLTELLRTVVEKPLLERSTLALEQATELAAVFVPTSAYNSALAKLAENGFVVLTGPPEMGKTTIARIISLAKLGEGWECYECTDPKDFLELRRSGEKQVFVADDAFGTTEYRPEIAYIWAKDMDRILRAVNATHWLIWTSRPAPLQMALQRMHLQGRAEEFPQPSEIIVDAAQLSRNEKALILYRHAKAASLEIEAKALVRQHAALLIDNPHFTPERVRRFVDQTLPRVVRAESSPEATEAAILQEVERPTISMKKSFDALGVEHRQVLVAMLDAGDHRVSSEELIQAHTRLSGRPCDMERLTQDLASHFLRISSNDKASFGFSSR
jgi:conflict system STAND superfamily ATPase